jgi:hypothetical protein
MRGTLNLLREDVDELALALVAPLCTEHHRKLGLAARRVQLAAFARRRWVRNGN